MKTFRLAIVSLAGLLLGTAGFAGETVDLSSHHWWKVLGQVRSCCFPCWCPVDYCRKPCPPAFPNKPCLPDDYCRKCLPPVPPKSPCTCDDYSPRHCPILVGIPCEPWFRCGPPNTCPPAH